MIEVILYIVCGTCICVTFLPTLPSHKNIIRYFDFPRLQILVLLIISIVFLEFIHDANTYILILAICAIFKILSEILPYSPLAQTQVPKASEKANLKIFTANVLQENNQHEGLLEEIKSHNPDIVFLVETNRKWQKYTNCLAKQYKYKVEVPLEEHNGMLLYSRFKLENIQIRYLVLDFIPSITCTTILDNGEKVKFYGVHPRPPRPQNKVENRDWELMTLAEEIRNQKLPSIITGDLNDVGWSPTTQNFLRISRLYDPRKGRGLFNTYNAKLWPLRWPLDHVFVSREFKLNEIKRLPYYGSDHYPIYIELSL